MATAGAAVLTVPCGLGVLTAPLLAFAIVQAAWIASAGMLLLPRRAWRTSPWFAADSRACDCCGIHTVPLGLAIISGALAGLTSATSGKLILATWPALLFLALTWATAVICLARFVTQLASHPWVLEEVDGAWFLVPAVPLGAAIATADVARGAPDAWRTALQFLALVAGMSGWLGYWLIAAAAARRVHRHGLGPKPRAPWWVAMGCAGLAAATIGKIHTAARWPATMDAVLILAVLVVAIVLMIPVGFVSARFLLRECRWRDPAAWPPTFSTAVFALGCLAAGEEWNSAFFTWLGVAAGYATLVFWAVTLCWNFWYHVQKSIARTD